MNQQLICTRAEQCASKTTCRHKTPHERSQGHFECDRKTIYCPVIEKACKCVPVKKESDHA